MKMPPVIGRALIVALLLSSAPAYAAPGVALSTGNTLLFFDSASPAQVTRTVALIGLSGGETMLAIDHRPITGVLYGASNAGQLYTIDPMSGFVMPLRSPFLPPLTSTEVAFDFDPAADRARVTAPGSPLIELAPLSGAAIGTVALAYRAGDRNQAATPSIVALAHDQNHLGATNSVLYGIDDALDVLVRIDPASGLIDTVGSLSTDAALGVSLDVSGGVAWALIGSALFRVDPAGGAATRIAAFPSETRGLSLLPPGSLNFEQPLYDAAEDSGTLRVVVRRSGGSAGAVSVGYTTADGSARAGSDYETASGTIDFADGQTSAELEVSLIADGDIEPHETFELRLAGATGGAAIGGLGVTNVTIVNDEHLGFFAITEDGRLITFDDENLGRLTSTATITGLGLNDTLIGIDFDTGGRLYALGAARRLYRLDPVTAVATPISAMPFAPALQGGAFGFEVASMRARISSDAEQNLSLDLTTASAAVALPELAYAMGDVNQGANPAITALAYDTNLYGIDQTQDVLVRLDATGMLQTAGPVGVNVGSTGGFDVLPSSPIGHAVLVVGFSNPTLFAIDLQSGRATSIGAIASGSPIRGLALGPSGRFDFGATVFTVREGESVMVAVERSAGDNGPASIAIELSGGTATPGVDYTFMRGEVRFAHRQTRALIEIAISADAEVEGVETAILRLDDPRAGTRSSATLSISDGDPPPIDGGVADLGSTDGAQSGDDAAINADGSVSSDAAISAADAGTNPPEEGCGCGVGYSRGSAIAMLLLLACLALRRKA